MDEKSKAGAACIRAGQEWGIAMAVEIMRDYGNYAAQPAVRHNAADNRNRAENRDAADCAEMSDTKRLPGAAGGVTADRAGRPDPAKHAAAESVTEYAKKLSKLAPSTKVKVGSSFPAERKGKVLTINPAILRKMQQDPEQERETRELIRSIEMLTKWLDGMDKAAGKKVIYRHGYIDENGKYYSSSCVRNERAYKMSEKLREERRKNAEALIERTREKAGRIKGRQRIKRKKPLWTRKPARTGSYLDIRL